MSVEVANDSKSCCCRKWLSKLLLSLSKWEEKLDVDRARSGLAKYLVNFVTKCC